MGMLLGMHELVHNACIILLWIYDRCANVLLHKEIVIILNEVVVVLYDMVVTCIQVVVVYTRAVVVLVHREW